MQPSKLSKRCSIYVAVKSSAYTFPSAPGKLPQLSKRHLASNIVPNARCILPRPFVSRIGSLQSSFIRDSCEVGKRRFTSLIFNPRENWRVVVPSSELDEKFRFKGGERSLETPPAAKIWRKPDALSATKTANLQRWLTNLTATDTGRNKSPD